MEDLSLNAQVREAKFDLPDGILETPHVGLVNRSLNPIKSTTLGGDT